MRKIIFLCLLLINPVLLIGQFQYDPFNYDFTEDPPQVIGNPAEENEDATYIFNKTLIWNGLLPETEYIIRGIIVHKMIYLNSDKALDRYNKIYLSVSEPDSLHLFKVRVIENGQVVREFGKADLKESTEDEGEQLRMLAVEGLKKGQMIERLSIELKPFAENASVSLQDDYPVLSRYVSVSCPQHLKFALKCYGFDGELKDTLFSENEMRYVYLDAGKVSPFKDENYVFTSAREMRIEIALEQNYATRKKLNSWADKGRNLFESLAKNEKAEKKYIDKLIEKQNWKELSGQKQLYEIDNYIKNNVNTSDAYPFIGNVDKLFSQKFGNKYSVVRVYMMIFQALDIKWQLALTLSKTEKQFDPDFPTNAYIKDPLFYFPDLKFFLDPTDYEYRAGDISFVYEGQKAMFIKPMLIGDALSGVTRIDQIPATHRSYSLRDSKISVTWDDEMNSTISTNYLGSGHAVDSRKIIYTLNEKEKADQFIETICRDDHKEGTFKVEEVLNSNLNNFDEYTKPVQMKYSWTTNVFTEQAGNNLLFKYGQLIGKQIELYDKKERENPIDFFYAHDHKVLLEIEIPEGYTAKGIDNKNKHLEFKDEKGNEMFGIDVKVFESNGKVMLEIFEYYASGSYSKEVYQQFREVINTAADINAFTLLLQKN